MEIYQILTQKGIPINQSFQIIKTKLKIFHPFKPKENQKKQKLQFFIQLNSFFFDIFINYFCANLKVLSKDVSGKVWLLQTYIFHIYKQHIIKMIKWKIKFTYLCSHYISRNVILRYFTLSQVKSRWNFWILNRLSVSVSEKGTH